MATNSIGTSMLKELIKLANNMDFKGMNFAKLITICMLSLFCMAPTCNSPTKNPEGLYQCITIQSSEAPVTGTWTDQ